MTDDLFASLGMSGDDATRAHAAVRRLTKECVDVTRERLRRGEQPNLGVVARNAVMGMRDALVGLALAAKQREIFFMLATAELLKTRLGNLEGTTTKRRVN